MQNIKRSTVQTDEGIKMQRTRFFESCLKYVEQNYSRLALLIIVRSLKSTGVGKKKNHLDFIS